MQIKRYILSQKVQELKANNYILIDVYPTSFWECLYIREAMPLHQESIIVASQIIEVHKETCITSDL